MKNIILTSVVTVVFFLCACSDKGKKNGENNNLKAQADSLDAQVMEGHDVGMAKYGRLNKLAKDVNTMIDSIAKLPAKARDAAEPLNKELQAVKEDLVRAKEGMDKWMSEYNADSALNNLNNRIKYLAEEKLKVSKIKDAILWSIHKADSLLKEKF